MGMDDRGGIPEWPEESPPPRGAGDGARRSGDGGGRGADGDGAEATDRNWSGSGGGERGAAFSAPRGGSGSFTMPGRIGRYRINSAIGRGGMGQVYDAVQDGTGLRVALKVMGDGLEDSGEARERFDAEARTLARLRHPNIARIHEAGICELSGREIAFIAMELIRGGQAITSYARSRNLSIHERVGLMLPVIRALQHAHAKPVIHRDLKPSNILVDEDGNPKVIDFGVCRLDEPGQPQTQFGQVMGTFSYMPPEQRSGDPADVDVRCDVFALGVVLHELLTGMRPMPSDRPAPRTRLRGQASGAFVPVSHHNPRVDADLALIVSKAIEPDPEARFQTAAQFGEQLQRWHEGRALTIGAVSGWKRVRKFVGRHRFASAVGAGMAAIVLMLVGMVLVSGLRAERSSAQSELLVAFLLEDLLGSLDPDSQGGAALTIEEMLARASGLAGERFRDEPALVGRIRLEFGWAWYRLRELDAAERDGLLAVRLLGEGDGDERLILRGRHLLAKLEAERQEYGSAREEFARLVDEYERVFPADSPELLEALRDISWTHMMERNYPEAIASLRPAEVISKRVADTRPEELILTQSRMADAMIKRAEYERALGVLDECLSRVATAPNARQTDIARIHTYRADALTTLGRLAEAEDAARKALVLREQVFPPDHSILCASRVYLAKVLTVSGKPLLAIDELRQAVKGYQQIPAGDGLPHRNELTTRVHLARAHARSGTPDEALRELDLVLDVMGRRGDPKTGVPWLNAAIVRLEALMELGRWDEALVERERLELGELPPGHSLRLELERLDQRQRERTPGE
ncbi:MAG: protein kinase domain-containing protein [Phycisphaerales bacterium]